MPLSLKALQNVPLQHKFRFLYMADGITVDQLQQALKLGGWPFLTILYGRFGHMCKIVPQCTIFVVFGAACLRFIFRKRFKLLQAFRGAAKMILLLLSILINILSTLATCSLDYHSQMYFMHDPIQ